ncbi:amino acid adenylation domain-containing protein, partial [Pseudomonas sp. No.117]
MNAEHSLALARRFIQLPLEKRRLFLASLHEEGVDFRLFPIPAGVETADRDVLSYAQRRMWLLWQLEPESAAYNLPGAVRLNGPLDHQSLEAACTLLVERHPTLRTLFICEADGEPRQVISDSLPELQQESLEEVPAAEREGEVRARAAAEARAPFDLEVGPLLRWRLLRLEAERHVLLLTLHHIVADGWSMNLLIDELLHAYAALHHGRQPDLAVLPVAYVDYALWQRRWLEAGEGERQLDYWRAQLGDSHPVLALPSDRPRPPLPSYRGERLELDVPVELAAALRARAQEGEQSLFMWLLASFQILLYRYSGAAEIRVGSPVANRNRQEVEGLIGLFVNTQVLCGRPRAGLSVADFLVEVRQTVLGAQDHQDLPFEQLVEALGVERSLSHGPLFQALYNHQPQVADLRTLPSVDGLSFAPLEGQGRTTQFDLALDTYEQGGQLRAALTYASDLFERSRIERMARHWLTLLAAMAADPRQMLDALPLLTPIERTQQLHDWNATQRDYPLEQPVHRLFEAQVRHVPEAPALVFGAQRLSYAELNRRANRLAHALIERGVGPEVLVGVALERSVELVVGLLAVLKAGGAYVPLDPDYPRRRLDFLLADSGIRLLLAQSHLELPAIEGVQRLDLDQDGDWLEHQPETDPEVALDGDNLAYVLYTSGSTGQPKGAGNRHRALTNRLCWMQEAYELGAEDAVLQKTPFSFDVSVWEFFWPLMTGARLVVAAPGDHRDPARLIELIGREGITTLHFVPSMLQAFLQDPGVSACTSLARLVCSGEALPVDTQQQVFAKLPMTRLYNLYGPTEAAIDVTHWTCVAEGRDTVPIGRPIANLGCLVLNTNLEPVPVGALGELYLSGVGLGRGYQRCAGLTAERFVANPFGTDERLYRTGDLARQRPDGVIEYAGRVDHQVKLRGLRIELGEIEARLLEHETVREAAVLALDGRQLVGYVVLHRETESWQQALATHLAQSLPEFMVPTLWLALEQMPLSPNGKLERRALPRPDATPKLTYQAPATPAEITLAAIWQDLLGVIQVGLDDNFFALGGDSIVAIQVVSRARRLGLQLSPRDLFQYQTLRALAQVAKPLVSESAQGPARGKVALAPVQAAFFARSIPNRTHWNQSLLLQAREPLDASRLTAALARLLGHHDALRLRFHEADGQWRQAYAEAAGEVLWQRRVDSPEALLALCEEAQRSLDLTQGPLLRALLVELADGSQRLLLAIHHLVVDGVSWRILLEDLQRLYVDATVDLGPRTSAYQAWTAAQHAQAIQRLEELPYWQSQLEGAATTLPGADPQGTLEYRQQIKLELTLDAERTRRLLQEAPAAYRTQVNDLLLTALTRAACRWGGTDSLLVELEGHGREETGGLDLSRTVGWFTSLYPVRLTAAEELGASIKAIKEQLRAVPDKGIGYGQLRHLAGAEVADRLGALPQPRITFNYLGRFDGQFGEDALLVPATEGTGAAQDPGAPLANWLTVEGQVYGGQLSLQWGFSRAMFAEADIQDLVEAFRMELEAVIEHCSDPRQGGVTPSDFPLLTLRQAQLDALPLPFREIEDLYPLSPMQEGLLVHTLMEPHSGIYFMQDRYVIDSDVEVDRFEAAWNAVIQRHDALRASFALDDQGSAYQIIHRQAPVRLSYHDWSERPAEHHEKDLQVLLATDRQQGFDLLQRPPFALRLIRRGPAQYWFILSNHHILIDAWCRSLLLQDFFQLYRGTEALPPAARYRDFLVWLQEQGKTAAISAWTAELQGFEEPTPLPFDRPITRQGGLSDIDDRYRDLTPAQGRALQQLAQRHGLTVNTLAQAAWALVLRCYSGRHDVLFGVTVAGRPVSRPEMQDTVGLFINSIPLRVRLPVAGHAMSVSDWLRALLAQNLALREHEHLALVDIQACSELERGQPLFDSLFVYENAPLERTVTQGAQALSARADTARTHTNYPLTVVVYPGDALGLHLSYDRRFLEATTVERLLADFARLLVALGEGFYGDVADLPLAAPEYLRQLQAERRDSLRDYPLNQGYAALFEAQVDVMGERLAARCGTRAWSYRELDVQANRVAHGLLAVDVTPDTGVALLAERDLELLALMIGTFKAGAGYVPLDPHLPEARLTDLLRLARVPVLICTDDCRERARQLLAALPSDHRPQLLDWTTLASRDDGNVRPVVASGPHHLAYVIYTSGSTGTPKGVMVEQAGMLNNQLSKVPYLNLGTDDAIAQTASQSFDISVWQFLAAPLFGGCTEILPNVIAHDPRALLQAVAARGVTVLESVPSLIQGLVAEDLADLGRLRWLLPTGEAMPPELARRWLQRYPQIALVNAYGPAECSDDVALCQVDEAATRGACLPIGRATDNNGVLALDDDLLPVPPGAIGELYIAGTGVGRGYLGDPKRTAQAYLPDPFALVPGERCYRSGDLARYRADGILEYVGRIDQQVKIRGFRIELGEIEARLREIEAVAAAVVAVQENVGGSHLVAYVVPADSEREAPALHDQCRVLLHQQLPEYMVPSAWLSLDALPLNANGKVDRKALPRLDFNQARRAYEAPDSALEQALADVWVEVLDVERIGRNDNFFELGGHSLLVTQVIARVRSGLGLELPLRALFERPVLADFALAAAQATRAETQLLPRVANTSLLVSY